MDEGLLLKYSLYMIKLLENFPKNVEQERIKNQLKLFLVAN